ncbi:MAG: rhomboid family intramembrane serine protease, partial [Bacteroidota bacterium]
MDQYRFGGFKMLPPVVKNLLIINVLMFLATLAIQSAFHFDLTDKLGLFFPKTSYFKPYQFVTHIFMHGGFSHLFLNMFALWMFGNAIENIWGGKRFFLYYMVTGLGAAFLHTLVNYITYSS